MAHKEQMAVTEFGDSTILASGPGENRRSLPSITQNNLADIGKVLYGKRFTHILGSQDDYAIWLCPYRLGDQFEVPKM